MLYALTVPTTFDEVTELRVLDWHGGPGHVFAEGDLVVELETHKVVVEVRAGQKAIMRKHLTHAGEWQKLGAALAVLSDSEDEDLPESTAELAQPLVHFEIV
jgi:pyruvate/2-oxoglutarate dehydrogenase complex dihydrolipoamide acyltransferase (E2) component